MPKPVKLAVTLTGAHRQALGVAVSTAVWEKAGKFIPNFDTQRTEAVTTAAIDAVLEQLAAWTADQV